MSGVRDKDKRKISCQYYIINMISGHDPNPIVLKNKKLKTRRPEHSLTPRPLHLITSHFCFVEQILDAVMKLVPIGFLSILKMQYIKGKVFLFL